MDNFLSCTPCSKTIKRFLITVGLPEFHEKLSFKSSISTTPSKTIDLYWMESVRHIRLQSVYRMNMLSCQLFISQSLSDAFNIIYSPWDPIWRMTSAPVLWIQALISVKLVAFHLHSPIFLDWVAGVYGRKGLTDTSWIKTDNVPYSRRFVTGQSKLI